MKKLKFAEPMPELILSKKKDITWRINDDKNLSCSDELSLIRTNGEEFGKAKILWVKETTFGQLSEEDKIGHENISSQEELLQMFSKYYNTKITNETKLKVIKFKLL